MATAGWALHPRTRQKYLGLEAGAVSPFGLINDTDRRVRVVLDSELKGADKVTSIPT